MQALLQQVGLCTIAKLCANASVIRLHAIQRGKPLQLGLLTDKLAAACRDASAKLAGFISEAVLVVNGACQQAMADLHARMEAFTQQQVGSTLYPGSC